MTSEAWSDAYGECYLCHGKGSYQVDYRSNGVLLRSYQQDCPNCSCGDTVRSACSLAVLGFGDHGDRLFSLAGFQNAVSQVLRFQDEAPLSAARAREMLKRAPYVQEQHDGSHFRLIRMAQPLSFPDTPIQMKPEWLVTVFKDGQPEIHGFPDYESAERLHEHLSLNWSDVLLSKVTHTRPPAEAPFSPWDRDTSYDILFIQSQGGRPNIMLTLSRLLNGLTLQTLMDERRREFFDVPLLSAGQARTLARELLSHADYAETGKQRDPNLHSTTTQAPR